LLNLPNTFSGSFFYFLTAVGTQWSAAGQIKPITGATHPTAKKINRYVLELVVKICRLMMGQKPVVKLQKIL